MFSNNVLGTSSFPFEIIHLKNKKYSIGSFRNIWDTKRKKREMGDVEIDDSSVQRANKIRFFLPRKTYKLFRPYIERDKSELLAKVGCNNFSQYLIKLKKNQEEIECTKDLYREARLLNDGRIVRDVNEWRTEGEKEYKKLYSIYQKLLEMETLEKDIFDKYFYLPCFMDNRGRQYYLTALSPTYYTIYRYMYEFADKREARGLEETRYYSTIMKYRYMIEPSDLGTKESYYLLILYYEIGKFFTKTESGNYMIKTETIIRNGMDVYKLKPFDRGIKERLYIIKLYNIIDNLLSNGQIDENTIIWKDATASGLQNYGIILDYNIEKIKLLNLDGEDWCDTYQFIIDKFAKDPGGIYAKRKYLKATIMTIPYNAT